MKVSCLWYGGYGYSNQDFVDVEYFDSLKEAKQVFIDRYNNTDLETPCISDNCYMWICIGTSGNMDNGPDYIISLGKKGGLIKIKKG